MIPFLNLRAQHEALWPALESAFKRVVNSSAFCLGEAVTSFEAAFAAYCGVRHCVGVNSGTSALHLALLAFDIGPGDEVITVPSTFVATVAAIRYTGATPVFVDVDPQRYTMDPNRLEAAITPRTTAILPVHLYGQMADMSCIGQIAAKHGLPVIEDAAQAHGATFNGKPAGRYGSMACFSFYPGKPLGALGEGGAVVTDNDGLATKIRAMRDWGQYERQVHHYPSFNYRMDGIQGALLEVKLKRLPEWVEARQRVAARYDNMLAELRSDNLLSTPRRTNDGVHAYHQYAIRVVDRDKMRRALTDRGVQTGVHYPIPVHLQPGFRDLGYSEHDFHVAEALAATTLSLPIYPELAPSAQDEVVHSLRAVLATGG